MCVLQSVAIPSNNNLSQSWIVYSSCLSVWPFYEVGEQRRSETRHGLVFELLLKYRLQVLGFWWTRSKQAFSLKLSLEIMHWSLPYYRLPPIWHIWVTIKEKNHLALGSCSPSQPTARNVWSIWFENRFSCLTSFSFTDCKVYLLRPRHATKRVYCFAFKLTVK